MFSIENALDLYTDMLNDGKKINIDLFKEKLSKDDFIEFLSLIPFINMAKAAL
jgi:hypothetical protein